MNDFLTLRTDCGNHVSWCDLALSIKKREPCHSITGPPEATPERAKESLRRILRRLELIPEKKFMQTTYEESVQLELAVAA